LTAAELSFADTLRLSLEIEVGSCPTINLTPSRTELVQYNPCIRGWISYCSHFYKTQLRPALKRIDAYVIRWARRKFKRLRYQAKGARD
jgi:hypothetical protein